MNATSGSQSPDTATLTRVKGWRLTLLWVIWIAIAVMVACVTFGAIRQFIHESLHGGPLTERVIEGGVSLSVFFPLEFSMSAIQMFVWYLIALLIIFRRHDDWVAIIASIMILVNGYFMTSFSNIWIAGHIPPQLAIFNNVGWLLDAIAMASFVIFFGTFPEGRFVPRWAMPIFAFLVLYVAVEDFIMIIDPGIGAVPGYSVLIRYVLIPVLIIVPPLYRRNKMEAFQRQQTKFALAGMIIGDVGNVIWQLAIANQPPLSQGQIVYFIARPITFILFLLAAVSFTYAILRYHLWDIDFVINRSLVYGGLTVLLGAVFIGGFFALRTIMGTLLGSQQDLVAAVIPAVAVTALFAPTRNGLRRFVDKRFYGIELDYRKVVAEQSLKQKRQQLPGGMMDAFGPYRNLELVGRGGMSEVYRALHPTLKHDVAIKILSQNLAGDEVARKRFAHEARAISMMSHPNIEQLYEYNEQDSIPYMVLEFLEGQTLNEMVRENSGLSLSEGLPILRDIASALDFAHAQGIVHRDIKPSNVIVEQKADAAGDKTRRAVLTDFGIAKLYDVTHLTSTGSLLGTLNYVSPEQIHCASEVDARSDIYSFGVMAYELLTGVLPFGHKNPGALVMAHLMQPAPDPRECIPDLPETAAKAVMKAMSKEPGVRQKTAGEFIAEMAGSETI